MQLQQAVNNVFVQLAETIRQLTPEQYAQPCGNLVNNTIGQHVRHIIELFQCLENGYSESHVNYEKRKRDKQIETNKDLALQLLQQRADAHVDGTLAHRLRGHRAVGVP